MKFLPLFLICSWIATVQVLGATRSSSSYSTSAESLDAGGGFSSSSSYLNLGSAGLVSGTSASSSYLAESGFAAQIGSPEIAIEQPSGTDLTSGDSSSDFGAVLVNAPKVKTYTLRNLGTVPLSGVSASVSGAHAGDFAVTQPAATVNGGSSESLTVTFTPSATGERDATLSIASNDADENPFVIALSGTGSTAQGLFDHAMTTTGLSGGNAQTGAMPFGDGVPNLLKYAFHMNLAAADHRTLTPGTGTFGLPVMGIVSGTLRYEYLRRKDSGLTYTPQQTSSLTTESWQSTTGTTTVTSIDETWERVVIEQPFQPGVTPTRFLRVLVGIE